MFSKLTLLCRVLPAFAIGLPALATQPGPQAWSLLAPAGTRPTPRQSPRIAYNPNTNRLILYGGYANMIAGPDAVPGDVWVLTHANGLGGTPEWIQSIPAFAPGSPPRRLDAETIYDPPSNRLILIGGLDPELPPGFCCISGV